MTIERFLDYLHFERNYSVKTIKEYGDDLAAFEAVFVDYDAGRTWKTVDQDIIRAWMESMMDKGNTAASVNRRLSALRTFYKFAMSHGMITSDPAHTVTGPKKEKPLPQFLREREMDALFDETMWNFDDFADVRARTILLVFYEAGLRIAELVGLDDAMVDLDACRLKVTGKRDKQRIIPFGHELRDALTLYIKTRDAAVTRTSPALFVSNKGERIKDSYVRREVKRRLSMVCTLKKRSPHVLRHTFATSMLNHGAGLESVKKLLGHESLATTEVYTHTTFEQLKKVYKTAHPRA